MASLKLNGVDKIYPSGSLALYDINFEAEDKEFLVIIGGEKSGKTTLLRTIAGLETVSSGEIFIGGNDVTNADPKDRNIAMVFRNANLYPALTVFDNIGFGLKLRKASQVLIEQRVKSVANILGLNDVLYRKPKTLTAAQKQRVAIGRAIAREPKVYLFDEPLSGLDDKLKAELLNIIINLQARMEGTFVYATKNVAEAMTIGTRIVVIKEGIIQQIDTPANLYDYPANSYVAFIIGAPSINFLNSATIVREEDGVYAVDGGLKVRLSDKVVKRFENLSAYEGTGKKVIVGIRPEDAVTGDSGIDAVAGKSESDNGATYTECSVGGHTLVVKSGKNAAQGSAVKVQIDCDRLYIFDAETRLTLLARDEGYVKTSHADADVAALPYPEEEDIKKKLKPEKHAKKKK